MMCKSHVPSIGFLSNVLFRIFIEFFFCGENRIYCGEILWFTKEEST